MNGPHSIEFIQLFLPFRVKHKMMRCLFRSLNCYKGAEQIALVEFEAIVK